MYVAEDTGIPQKPKQVSRKRKYPWQTMKVWQSFFVPESECKSIAAQASMAGKILGVKFSCRKTIENGVRGTRVNRVA